MVAQKKPAEPTVINGINVDDLFALIEGVRREPAKGRTNWRVTTTWQARRGAVRKSRVLRSEENGYRAGSRSTSTNLTNLEDRTVSQTRRNI
jgi:hypothetical protein